MYIRHFGANEKEISTFAYDNRAMSGRVFVHAYMCVYMSVCKYVRMCVCMYMCVLCMCVCMYVCVCMNVRAQLLNHSPDLQESGRRAFCHCWRIHCDFYWTRTRIMKNEIYKDNSALSLSQA